MPGNMSFFLTTQQVKDETKDVTRRLGWWKIKQGEQLWAVKKAMGLRKGEKIERLKLIEVVSVSKERLNRISVVDVVREGFPGKSPQWFIDFIVGHYGVNPDSWVNRILHVILSGARSSPAELG